MRWIIRLFTHGIALVFGFGLGVYLLPIITAPPSIDRAQLALSAESAEFTAQFTRDLAGSDFLHWAEGTVSVLSDMIVHEGKMAPGPDYKLYLTPEFVDDEASFNAIKARSINIADIKNFDGFIANVPSSVDITAYNTVLIWCETFGEFISAAKYR